MGPTVQVQRFEASAAAIGAARAFARSAVRAVGGDGDAPAEFLERLSLVVSELATNAVLHAGTAFEVQVRVGEHVVRVAVHDLSERPPVQRLAAPDAASGRGMEIVAALSSQWGVASAGDGKWVWAELERPQDARSR